MGKSSKTTGDLVDEACLKLERAEMARIRRNDAIVKRGTAPHISAWYHLQVELAKVELAEAGITHARALRRERQGRRR